MSLAEDGRRKEVHFLDEPFQRRTALALHDISAFYGEKY
jgi:hypothetical protein